MAVRALACLRERFGKGAAEGLEAEFQHAERKEAKLRHFLRMAETSPQAAPCEARAETEQGDILDLLAKMALYAPEVWFEIVTGLERPQEAKNDWPNIAVAFDASSRVRRAGFETYHRKLSQKLGDWSSYVYVPFSAPESPVLTSPRALPAPGTVRLVAISDTHLLHQSLDLPAGDLLVHCGDLSYEESRSREGQLFLEECRRSLDSEDFEGLLGWLEASCPEMLSGLRWLSRQRHEHRVLVGGNHDFILEQLGSKAEKLCQHFGIQYLHTKLEPRALNFNSGLTLRIWGSGVSFPSKMGQEQAILSGNRAFQLESGAEFRHQTAHLQPLSADVLITHGPPKGCLYGKDSNEVRCVNELLRKVRPALFLCGHAHNPDGMKLRDKVCTLENTLGVNCAVTGVWNQLYGHPFVVDVPAACGEANKQGSGYVGRDMGGFS